MRGSEESGDHTGEDMEEMVDIVDGCDLSIGDLVSEFADAIDATDALFEGWL